jgi:hypothetical protein
MKKAVMNTAGHDFGEPLCKLRRSGIKRWTRRADSNACWAPGPGLLTHTVAGHVCVGHSTHLHVPGLLAVMRVVGTGRW